MSEFSFVKDEFNPEYWKAENERLQQQLLDKDLEIIQLNYQLSIYKTQCELYNGALNSRS